MPRNAMAKPDDSAPQRDARYATPFGGTPLPNALSHPLDWVKGGRAGLALLIRSTGVPLQPPASSR